MKARTRTVRTLDLDLPAGRALRCVLTLEEDGTPGRLTLSEGWASGGTDHRRTVQLPGDRVEALRDALTALLEVDG
jgi:hypothetical protein